MYSISRLLKLNPVKRICFHSTSGSTNTILPVHILFRRNVHQSSSSANGHPTAFGLATYQIVHFDFKSPKMVDNTLELISHAKTASQAYLNMQKLEKTSQEKPLQLGYSEPYIPSSTASFDGRKPLALQSLRKSTMPLPPTQTIPILPQACLENYEDLISFAREHGGPENTYLVRKSSLKEFLDVVSAPKKETSKNKLAEISDTSLDISFSSNLSFEPTSKNEYIDVFSHEENDIERTLDQQRSSSESELTKSQPTSLASTPVVSFQNAPTEKASTLVRRLNDRTKELSQSKRSSDVPVKFPTLTPLEQDMIHLSRKNAVSELESLFLNNSVSVEDFVFQKESKNMENNQQSQFTDPMRLNLNAQPDHGGTALHQAAAYGNIDVIRVLIEAGANINVKAPNGSTPLHWAAGNGQADAVRYLLDFGADPYATTSTWCIDLFGKHSGQTPLHWASESGFLDCVRILHTYAPLTIGLVDEKDATPLQLATKEINIGVMDFIKEALEEEYVAVSLSVFTQTQSSIYSPSSKGGNV